MSIRILLSDSSGRTSKPAENGRSQKKHDQMNIIGSLSDFFNYIFRLNKTICWMHICIRSGRPGRSTMRWMQELECWTGLGSKLQIVNHNDGACTCFPCSASDTVGQPFTHCVQPSTDAFLTFWRTLCPALFRLLKIKLKLEFRILQVHHSFTSLWSNQIIAHSLGKHC